MFKTWNVYLFYKCKARKSIFTAGCKCECETTLKQHDGSTEHLLKSKPVLEYKWPHKPETTHRVSILI